MREDRNCTRFWWESPMEGDHLEDRGVEGRRGSKMDLKETGWEVKEWIHMAQNRDRWRILVNAVMNLRVLAPRSWLVGWFVGWLVGYLVTSL
jgi:hypothetical protein